MSSKSVSFKKEISVQIKPLNLLDSNKERSINTKNSLSSFDQSSTKYSINDKRKKNSIFSNEVKFSNNFSPNIRIDAFGNEINKKVNKNYKISFIDQISSRKIAEVILIDISYNKNIQNKEECFCSSCFIF